MEGVLGAAAGLVSGIYSIGKSISFQHLRISANLMILNRVDPKKGKAGLIASETLPFMDAEVLKLFDELERATYGHPPAKEGERMNFMVKPSVAAQVAS